jgi:beta-phosphoglucomutase
MNKKNINIKLCIFDLDGVIVDTAKYHFLAWRELGREFGFELTKEDNEKLKGVSRVESLKLILKWANVEKSIEQQKIIAANKNEHYVNLIQSLKPDDIFPGVKDFILELKKNKIKISIGSASKNTRLILEKLQITDFFDHIVDGNMTVNSKPHPEVFLQSTKALNIDPKNTVVFEDAAKGIDAALAGEMFAVGIGDVNDLGHANMVVSGFIDFNIKDLLDGLKKI